VGASSAFNLESLLGLLIDKIKEYNKKSAETTQEEKATNITEENEQYKSSTNEIESLYIGLI
jgi:hypothetical protein